MYIYIFHIYKKLTKVRRIYIYIYIQKERYIDIDIYSKFSYHFLCSFA